jgi:hypothetical protein
MKMPEHADGYVMKDLLPEHAELAAKEWKNWFVATWPVDLKVKYLRELIIRYGAIGIFTSDDLTQPIGWIFRKNGMCITSTDYLSFLMDQLHKMRVQATGYQLSTEKNALIYYLSATDSVSSEACLSVVKLE